VDKRQIRDEMFVSGRGECVFPNLRFELGESRVVETEQVLFHSYMLGILLHRG
jgi:hypothetical protein